MLSTLPFLKGVKNFEHFLQHFFYHRDEVHSPQKMEARVWHGLPQVMGRRTCIEVSQIKHRQIFTLVIKWPTQIIIKRWNMEIWFWGTNYFFEAQIKSYFFPLFKTIFGSVFFLWRTVLLKVKTISENFNCCTICCKLKFCALQSHF